MLSSLETVTRQVETIPRHGLILTRRAIRDICDNGYISTEDFAAAAHVVDANLGGLTRNEVHVQRAQGEQTVGLLGDSMRLICTPDRENPRAMAVLTVQFPIVPDLERDREHAMPYRAVWIPLKTASATPPESDASDLLTQFVAFEKESQESRERRSSRKEFIEHWYQVIRGKEQELAEAGLNYLEVEKNEASGWLKFTLSEPPPDNMDWDEGAPLAVGIPSQSPNRGPRSVSVGSLREMRGRAVFVDLPDGRSRRISDDIPAQGRLALDPRQVRSDLRRQRSALNAFLNGQMVNPSLGNLIVDPSGTTRAPDQTIDYYQDHLSEDKKETIRKALASNELFLVQGPPGTGKTTVIAEIILQILKRDANARILMSSQSNVAVDHVLSKVAEAAQAASIAPPDMIRLGRLDKVSNELWTVNGRSETMRKEIQSNCMTALEELNRAERNIRANAGMSPTRPTTGQLVEYDADATGAELSRIQNIGKTVRDWTVVAGRTDDFRKLIVEQSKVVGATCSYSGARDLEEARFEWAIIDEAGRATVPEVLIPIVKAERAIMVGDERQLPPMVEGMMARETDNASYAYRLETSLFQSLVEQAEEGGHDHLTSLRTQYRMHPAIGNLIGDVFYEGKLVNGVAEDARPNHGWMPAPVTWLSTSDLSDHRETRQGSSFANRAEVDAILGQLRDFENMRRARGWDNQVEVGIISGYQGQVEQLNRVIAPDDANRWQSLRIEVATVDAFQGRECDVVVYSTVRSNPEGRIGFLVDRRRINVALSRAKDLLVIVGDDRMMRSANISGSDNPFERVIDHIESHPEGCIIQPIGDLG